MKKKILTLCLVVALAATAVIGGTLAYFTDTAKTTNVLTAGDVKINLEEYTYNENDEKVPFDDEVAMTMYPMTDAQGYENINKIVDVHNTSKEDPAYIRTIVAFEKLDSEGVEGMKEIKDELHFLALKDVNYPDSQIYGSNGGTYWGDVTISGEEYEIFVFDTYNKVAVPAGAKMQSLQSVWLDKDFTMDHMSLLGEDGKLNVLVVAQGVQTANFDDYDAAFAATFELTEANIISWFSAADNAVINGADN
ncbi:MAG: hypothetical protein E7293_06460 [Lachnospiraceae bacterium]|nr:hypothetical protein [Lachnospiraceae bacterium]